LAQKRLNSASVIEKHAAYNTDSYSAIIPKLRQFYMHRVRRSSPATSFRHFPELAPFLAMADLAKEAPISSQVATLHPPLGDASSQEDSLSIVREIS
jgi:hypothetical protein